MNTNCKYHVLLVLLILGTQSLVANPFLELDKKTSTTSFIDGECAEDKLSITDLKQKVSFELTKKNELISKLTVSIVVKSNTNATIPFNKSIFIDDNSEIDYILYKDSPTSKKSHNIENTVFDYQSDGIFHSDLKVCNFDVKLFEKGEEILIKYQKTYTDYKFLDPLYFNDYYEVENSTIEIEVPSWLDLDIRELNFDKEKPAVSNKNADGHKIYSYNLKDLNSAFREKSSPRRSNFNAHLILISKSIKVGGKSVRLMEDISDLYGWYRSLVKEIGNDNADLKKTVTKIIAGKNSDEEKIKSIFYWVQDNIKYIAFEEGIMGFRPESCQTVYNNKYGDCKGMANLTKEMLNIAGYDARLTWIGTRDLPYTYDIPSLVVDNHMICSIMLNGKRVFLDATEKYVDLYNYAYRIQGKQVLIEDKDAFIIEEVPMQKPEESKQVVINKMKIEGDKLIGTGVVTYTGNRKTWMLNKLAASTASKRSDELTSYLSNYDKNVSLKLDAEVSLENRDNDLLFNYQFDVNNHIIDLENELYISPELEYPFKNFTIKEDRKVPYDFSETFLISEQTNFDIPTGYKVQYFPEKIAAENDKYSFQLSFSKNNNQITYTKNIEIKHSILAVNDFEAWNSLIEKLNAFYADQIILEKN